MVPEHAASELDLHARWLTLRRRKGVVLLCLVLILGGTLAYSYSQPKRYAAVAKILLRNRTVTQVIGSETQSVDQIQSVETEVEVITTEPVETLVRAKIGRVGVVKVARIGQTELITIRGESVEPAVASATANAYAKSYIEYRRKQTIDELFAGSEEVQAKITELQRQIEDLSAQLDAAPVCVDPRTSAVACTQRNNIEQTVGARRTTLQNQQALYRSRLDQLQVDQALTTGGAQIVTPASTPTVPFEPRHRQAAVLGLLMGLVFGVGLAFLIDHLDDSIKGKDDLERAVPGLGVIGLIPVVSNWRSKEQSRVVSLTDPNSPAAEAYRILRTSIQFLSIDRPATVIQVTSASAQEGKTTTLANLAVAFASSGLRTVAVCCDLRRPRLHQFFGLDNEVGFTSVLLGKVALGKALQPVPGQDRLLVLASGPLPPNPAELLSSSRTADLFRGLSGQADIVLIDSPPVLPVTDSIVLSQRVDSTVLVSSAGTTTRKAAHRAAEMLQQVNAPLIGAVLNGVTEESGYWGYASSYYTTHNGSVASSSSNGNGRDKTSPDHKKAKRSR